ncbi:MAG: membrane dipeptidase [Eggerthellaceae bacterium]|nr:membrane dipeptidase [Eggerthellaceae bacterium]
MMKLRVFDLHCDTLDRLSLSCDPTVPGGFYEHDASVPRARMSKLDANDADISLERMAAFDWCQCFAVFVPDQLRGADAWALFERVKGFWEGELARCGASLRQVHGLKGALRAFDEGKSAGILTVEGCSFLEDDGAAEGRLDSLSAAGVRMATLTWNGPNALGSGNDTSEGLTPFGKRMVVELERRGIAVDASHLNRAGFKDLLDVAELPFACSHSNARAVCGHPRNLEDWQLREIAQRGGIVGLNYYNDFLREDGGRATPDDLLRHVDRVLEVAGESVLALGSDYDGSDVPEWLTPCSKVSDLHALLAREFGAEAADAIFFGNVARFFDGD